MGASGVAAALVGGSAGAASASPALASARDLPLGAGQRFGRWVIAAVHPLEDGALVLDVKGTDDRAFSLEILARDPSPLAPRPPASTEALAIYVKNRGDGWSPTEEEEGLAAMTLAHVLEASGHGGAVAGLLTHTQRVVHHNEKLTGDGRDPRFAG
jgi:hypothetical protein